MWLFLAHSSCLPEIASPPNQPLLKSLRALPLLWSTATTKTKLRPLSLAANLKTSGMTSWKMCTVTAVLSAVSGSVVVPVLYLRLGAFWFAQLIGLDLFAESKVYDYSLCFIARTVLSRIS